MEDILLKNGNITHNGGMILEDEENTTSLENNTILIWLRLVYNVLPKLVRYIFGTERNRALASIKSEISHALPSLLDDIRSSDDVEAMRSTTSIYTTSRPLKSLSNTHRQPR